MDAIQIINPLTAGSWDELIHSNVNGSFFHSSNWARVLAESYNYLPLFFSAIHNGRLVALIPCMEVNSIITGKRGVSLPFTDFCEPIFCNEIDFGKVFEKMVQYGTTAGWKYIELRPGALLTDAPKPSSLSYGHVLDLAQDTDKLYAGFRNSTKRNVKRAQNSGVKVIIGKAGSSVKEFYRLHCGTRKEHGLPPQPYNFFKKIYRHIISKDHGIAVLASYKGVTIAGALYFHFGRTAIYKYGASDRYYRHLRANNLVMWDAIHWYCRHGFNTLHFGRTEPENTGLLQFKRGWNTREHVIAYYRYDLKRGTFITNNLNVSGAHNQYFRKMPIPLLRLAGSILYRHMA